jgi:hypothetical protein
MISYQQDKIESGLIYGKNDTLVYYNQIGVVPNIYIYANNDEIYDRFEKNGIDILKKRDCDDC